MALPDKDTLASMMGLVPQLSALGIELCEMDKARAKMRLPWADRLVAYADSGVMAGGAVFTLLDSVLGTAVFSALPSLVPVATLDLRVDYLKPATPGRDLFASAHCYKLTRQVAFVRGVAFHDTEDSPIAHATASFILNRPSSQEASSEQEAAEKDSMKKDQA
ncbi:hypothetical protein JCM17844_09700 [Iodidimonas gelatinilytica]|uniref:Thioesterase domain-containing protein n=1 Tax=Iodidimonas gelatinilytica TaxID=1236966 RepID=A0A5A7MQ67_9PROT|nr:PaaI family thioesterase [Iodidimonas gelatinilytica]GEQ97333.1 hypothetical protein JCM17844_09700 [Iodidimonas gelatinilytica]